MELKGEEDLKWKWAFIRDVSCLSSVYSLAHLMMRARERGLRIPATLCNRRRASPVRSRSYGAGSWPVGFAADKLMSEAVELPRSVSDWRERDEELLPNLFSLCLNRAGAAALKPALVKLSNTRRGHRA